MKLNFKTLAATLGALALTTLATPNASAVCGSFSQPSATHTSWHYQFGTARLLTVSEHEAGIVGFWHFKFASKGTAGVPDGAPLDAGYSHWHSDGTEIMNSGHFEPLEEVTLTDKDHYNGTVTIDNYNQAGGLLSHLQGLVTGVRIDIDTPVSSIF